MVRRGFWDATIVVAVTGVPAAAFVWLKTHPSADAVFAVPTGHFYVVSAVSVLSASLALITAIGAVRTRNARMVLLALSFTYMAGMFAVHGLATPGFLVDRQFTAVLGFSARMSVVLASCFLALSAIDPPAAVARTIVRWRLAILLGAVASLIVYAFAALRWPESIPPRVMSEQLFLRGTLAMTLALSLYAAIRYYEGYRRAALTLYGTVALGAALLFEAQIAMHFGAVWAASWWIYHFALFGAFASMLFGVVLESARGTSPIVALEGLTLSDPIAQIQAGYTRVVHAFATSLEARDGYTHGHGKRVAALSVLIGERMGLAPWRLRGLAQGALLHDIGKIGVPDGILRKPGPLSDEEYEEIKQHPQRGETMLQSAFSGEVELGVIRWHHERFDGGGYPDGLVGFAIPLEARIATVADVYDALRSARAYRGPWDRAMALEYIREQSASHFDPFCVEVFFQVVDQWELQFSAEAEGAATVVQQALAA
jgi:HD-GYP domain-containing protein (c-di-GMP phosphodiesterase class II)